MISISTHVLDTGRGGPAAGVRVELWQGDVLLRQDETGSDGRIAELAPGGVEPGAYRLVFHPRSPFFRRIELEVELDDASSHYHVPLLVSPYSCASYRGN